MHTCTQLQKGKMSLLRNLGENFNDNQNSSLQPKDHIKNLAVERAQWQLLFSFLAKYMLSDPSQMAKVTRMKKQPICGTVSKQAPTPAPSMMCWCKFWLFCCQSSSLLIRLKKQQQMALVLESLSPMQETQSSTFLILTCISLVIAAIWAVNEQIKFLCL